MKCGLGLFGSNEEQLTQVVGHDSILLFGLTGVIAPATGFDVRQWQLQTCREQSSCQGGIGVAIDHDPVRFLRTKNGLHAREHAGKLGSMGTRTNAEVVFRSRYFHLLEKYSGNFAVIMLSGVDNLVLNLSASKLAIVLFDGAAKRSHFDKLRTRPDDADPLGPCPRSLWLHVVCSFRKALEPRKG